MRWPLVLCVAVCISISACSALPSRKALGNLTGTLKDVKHIVIFMQENRPFDHYYGKLRGGRGFADRTAPITPANEPIWYQHVKDAGGSSLCGCSACDLKWLPSGNGLKALIEGMSCKTLSSTSPSWTPPVKMTEGEKCSDFLADLLKAKVDGMVVSEMLSSSSSCDASLKVHGTTEQSSQNDAGYILPFHLAFNKTAASCMGAPSMGYDPDIPIFNEGHMDRWNSARKPGFGMSYFERTDLPYYYALADAFTFGDHYYQSTFTATCPNREMLFSGSNGLSVPGSGMCLLDDSEPSLTWETMGETLENAGVSWKLYQQQDNFDDNGFAWFAKYKAAKPGDVLYEKGMRRGDDFVADFAKDVANDTLPQVSWLVGPASLSEHASNHPADGEDLTARILKVLGAPENSRVFSKTVFILNYDEGGQFFDHLWTPVATKAGQGQSTVTTVGELTVKEQFNQPAGNPIGLGFRVPFMVISPWSRGGHVFSEVSDHTSVIKLIEQRFDVRCPNISPWRRAVTGDLTAALDFTSPDFSPWPTFPDTSANVNTSKKECDTLPPPTLPKQQQMPAQEPGTRPSRALPYEFDVRMVPVPTAQGANLTFRVENIGRAAVVIFMYDRVNTSNIPRKYTVESGKVVSEVLSVVGPYGFSAHGPNGFVRQWGGSAPTWATPESASPHGNVSAMMRYDVAGRQVVILMENAFSGSTFNISDNAYGQGSTVITASAAVGATPQEPLSHHVDVSSSGNWYDISVRDLQTNAVWRFMGRMETGEHSISDPASGSGRAPTSLPAAGFAVGLEGSDIYKTGVHAPVPEWYRTSRDLKLNLEEACKSGRGRQLVKDACFVRSVKTEL